MGWVVLVCHTVGVATLSERGVLLDVLNLQLDQRKFSQLKFSIFSYFLVFVFFIKKVLMIFF